MVRALWVLGLLGVVIAVAVWLTDNPGRLDLQWRGYRIETSAAVLVALVVLFGIVAALAYRAWLGVVRAPGRVASAWRERRRRRGYQALTRGMVAVAAGDPGESQKQAKRAEVLLNEPPLTMLLSAQSAQLNGDDKAAEGFFAAMTESPETEFLGLRGLMSQALKAGDRDRALALARRAYRLQPKSEWVATTLFDLQVDAGLWLDASVTSDELGRRRLIEAPQADRRKAVLAFEQSRAARARGDGAEERRLLRQASDAAPDLVPAVIRWAQCLNADGKNRRAAGLIEKTWARAPHPDLVVAYLEIRQPADALAAVKVVEKLIKANADHSESRLAAAGVAVDAELWGEARKYLSTLTEAAQAEGFQGQAYRLMAKIEERERQDLAAAGEWLVRASTADPDRTWVCGQCGNTTDEWTVSCGNCGGFDAFAWDRPPHVGRLALQSIEESTAEPSNGSANLPAPVPRTGV